MKLCVSTLNENQETIITTGLPPCYPDHWFTDITHRSPKGLRSGDGWDVGTSTLGIRNGPQSRGVSWIFVNVRKTDSSRV